NGTWSYVGGLQSSYGRVNYFSIQVDDNEVPHVGYIFARATAPYPSRGTFVASYANGTWTGQTFTEASTAAFSKMVKGRDGALYYIVMDLTAGAAARKPSIYKLQNNTWVNIGLLVGPA